MTVDWNRVSRLARKSLAQTDRLDDGQRESLGWIVGRLRECDGVVLADEVGTGKTRIACAVIHAVLAAGGRVATVVPRGLMHQWVAESRKLDPEITPKQLTTLPELFRNTTSLAQAEVLAPCPKKSEWWLLSHGFRAPKVGYHLGDSRAALPALVELQLASKARREDKRTWEGKLTEWLILSRNFQKNLVRDWYMMEQIARDVAPYVRPLAPLRRKMKNLPEIGTTNRDSDGDFDMDLDLEAFREAGVEGITEELLGLWLGDFDLIVVDEAHKSRGMIEDDDDASRAKTKKVLARLLDEILRRSTTARRLCLTATPMELDLHQWRDLLNRAGCPLGKEGEQVVERFRNAVRETAIAPDEVARLDGLCDAAREFTRSLKPYVTRRRRTEDPLIKEFIRESAARGGESNSTHPHRKVERLRIGLTEVREGSTAWPTVLFAAECMSHAARGLPQAHTMSFPPAIRDAYTKLCRGHVSADFEDAEVSIPVPDKADEYTRGKIMRVNYWFRQLREARGRGSDTPGAIDALFESEHPRITAAVREIEAWTNPSTGPVADGSSQAEKVLLFGVFLKPLHVLRNVLNVRSTLRTVDAGQPIAHSIERNDKLMPIAIRQLERLRAGDAVRGRLATAGDGELRRALGEAHAQYEALQRRVRRLIADHVSAWFENPQKLGGVDVRKFQARVRAHTMAFVLDDFLSGPAQLDALLEGRVATLADEYFRDHLQPELTELEADDDDARAEALRAVFEDDPEARQRTFAVLLEGGTKPTTRRYMQAAFNRPRSSPRVLLAQSQVGREGLNLHEACRVVIQFHAEWNPAILEQQIGRVDRKGSLWEKLAREWLGGDKCKPMPLIEVRQLVFEGTYDSFQWERVMRRQHVFDASLFGTLLPAAAWLSVPINYRQKLIEAAPSFKP